VIIIISPSKTIKNTSSCQLSTFSKPYFHKLTNDLVQDIQQKSSGELQRILGTSVALTHTAFEYFKEWDNRFNSKRTLQAILAFNGDVYTGMSAQTISNDTLLYSQDHLIILSALYGALRPLDLIQPYRLDLTDRYTFKEKSLNEFWRKSVTDFLKNQLSQHTGNKSIINLASNEYFKLLDVKKLNSQVVTPVFKDYKNSSYRTISLYAKIARGKMTRYILDNELTHPEQIKSYSGDTYVYNDEMSSKNTFCFVRG